MQQIFLFINIYISYIHVSGDKIRPSSGELFKCIYSFWYNAATLLPTGATVEMECQFHLNRGTSRTQCRCIVTRVVYTVKKCS